MQLQAGITVQSSRYDEPMEWSADEENLTEEQRYSDRILRTPSVYGYFSATYTPIKPLSIALNGNYTGKMYVPHLFSEIDGSADVFGTNPRFFELGAKVAYDLDINACLAIQCRRSKHFQCLSKGLRPPRHPRLGYIPPRHAPHPTPLPALKSASNLLSQFNSSFIIFQ